MAAPNDGDMAPAPDFTRNYIRVPRAVRRALRADGTTLLVYLELLDRAAFQAGPRMIAGRVVTLDIGQCVVGRSELAASCLTSEQTIRTSLNHLQTLQLITIQSTSRGSVITVRGLLESTLAHRADQPAGQPADQPAGSPDLNQDSISRSTTNVDLRSENRDLKHVGGDARAPARSQDTVPPTEPPNPHPHRLPIGWVPEDSEANRTAAAEATERGVDVDQQLASLREQSGEKRRDWDARWRHWLSIAHPAKPQAPAPPAGGYRESKRDIHPRTEDRGGPAGLADFVEARIKLGHEQPPTPAGDEPPDEEP
jgi:hypothetical protein